MFDELQAWFETCPDILTANAHLTEDEMKSLLTTMSIEHKEFLETRRLMLQQIQGKGNGNERTMGCCQCRKRKAVSL